MKTDLYERVTAQIVTSLEQGVRPWLKPWSMNNAMAQPVLPRRGTGEHYRGVNILLLWGAAFDKGFTATTWMTFKQALEHGGAVRKGETGSKVVYAGSLTRSETDEAGNEDERRIPYLKEYTVFNVEQIDGLPERFTVTAQPTRPTFERIEAAEQFMTGTGATIRHGGAKAFYSPSTDHVQMPPREAFRDAIGYYGVMAHELTHWTGHASRLARQFGKRFADKAYAFEELVAELGSAFVAADLGLSQEPREDHAAYLSHWLDILKADKRAIFTAASQAQAAADYLTRQEAA